MGKRQAAQIAALERDNARLIAERDEYRRLVVGYRDAARHPQPDPSLADLARREFHHRWGWLADLAGFGK